MVSLLAMLFLLRFDQPGTERSSASTELYRFRQGAWTDITMRKHQLLKVYVSEQNSRDVVVLGRVTFGHRRGDAVTQDFVGNFIFEECESGPLIQSYQAWLVSRIHPA